MSSRHFLVTKKYSGTVTQINERYVTVNRTANLPDKNGRPALLSVQVTLAFS